MTDLKEIFMLINKHIDSINEYIEKISPIEPSSMEQRIEKLLKIEQLQEEIYALIDAKNIILDYSKKQLFIKYPNGIFDVMH